MKLVEVALEGKFVCCPDSFETLDEFPRSAIPLRMIKPPLSNTGKLGFEPSGNDVDSNTPNVFSSCKKIHYNSLPI